DRASARISGRNRAGPGAPGPPDAPEIALAGRSGERARSEGSRGDNMNRRLDRTTCEETFRRLDDYLDRNLAADEARLIEEHLQQCEACSREFVFEASVIKAVRGKLRRLDVPWSLLDRISQALSRAAQEGEGSADAREPPR